MFILHEILTNLKSEFPTSRKGHERSSWFIYTILAILVPFTSSKTSNILRCLKALFGISGIGKNDSTPSWHHPRFLGNGFGKGFGR